MRYLSLFSGIEAATVAWRPLGWSAVGFAEIDPFCCALLSHHYPEVPNLGSVVDITQEQIGELGEVNLVVGGFPCQDLSVAGKRKGLHNDDGTPTRSGLFFDALRIAEWSGARWLVVENVPGLFSSNFGRDFAAVVGAMAGLRLDVPSGGWRTAGVVAGPLGMVEWRVLDAQYVRTQSHPRAVPQRRRRVFIVRDSGDWRNRPPVLLERACLCGHPAPRREAGEGVAGDVPPSLRGGGPGGNRVGDTRGQDPVVAVAGTLDAHYGTKWGLEDQHVNAGCPNFIVSHTLSGEGSIAGSVRANAPGHNSTGTLLRAGIVVRRLTPLEAERLQGFPDHYTLVPHRGKPAADAPRYKALGNSMACNVMRWIGRRIDMVDSLAPPSPT